MIVLLVLVVVVVLVVIGIRSARGRGGAATGGGTSSGDGHGVRRFFQYLLLYGLLVIVGVGLTGLIGVVLERGSTVLETNESEVALSLSYTLVGVPLYAALAWWSRRRLAEDPTEAASLGWALYIGLASLTSLISTMLGLYAVLAGLTGVRPDEPAAWGQVVVWGAVWGAHWWVDHRVTPPARSRLHHLAGSLIGLGTSVAGLAIVVSGVLAVVLGLNDQGLLAGGDDRLLRGVCVVLVGAPVWVVYWLLTLARSERDTTWLVQVLLAGIGGGLVLAITAASLLVFDVLVWLVGEPSSSDPAAFFAGAPTQAGAALTGVLSWWYHRAVLARTPGPPVLTRPVRAPGLVGGTMLGTATGQDGSRPSGRGGAVDASPGEAEVWRVYTYLLAGIGLAAAAVGLTLLIVAVIEAITGSAVLVIGGSAVNTLLGAVTLFLVGGPVWLWFWRHATRATHLDPAAELASPTRRIYLYLWFGVGGVAAVIALIVGVFTFVDDMLQGGLSAETLRSMRVPIGILVTTGAISAYHWAVFQSDRRHAPTTRRGPGFVLLVGPPRDPALVRALAARTGARVHTWPRADAEARAWTVDEVLAALGDRTDEEVIVLEDDGEMHTIPVHRR